MTSENGQNILVELSVIPLGIDSQISDYLAEVLRMVDESGLAYQLTPSGTCIEGEWDEVMPLMRDCHDYVCDRSSHVITLLKIEEEAGAENKIVENVVSVSDKVGKILERK